ncbi:MAG: hypothetical protein CVU55_06280 [Deltaproteobacteria bacterium HGW-Deltaproteobacteria-13]|nr:MAG: hypothetical protein CVU55_06280 [Deltaproteobacteria bacterium HGW-Deltaproteobacteria-13]
MENQPAPWDMLYKNLFVSNNTFTILSDGFDILLANVERLVKDANLLKDTDGYMTASFLGSTAREEMAKVHILIDACRLNFSRHESVLKRLCRAYYSHIAKYAYYNVLSLPRLGNMEEVKEMWENDVKKWWPSAPESGEPDMPHDTKYLREMPLYVDYSDWDGCWYSPQRENGSLHKSARLYSIKCAEEELALFRITHNAGLYKEESLSIINEIYMKQYVNENTKMERIYSLYGNVANQIEKRLAIPKEKFINSFITKWPLYPFVENF